MISTRQIQRQIEHEAFEQLVQRVLANGRCESRAVSRRLSHPSATLVAALGLALQRLTEITYRPDPLAAGVADRLLRLQRAEGLFAAGSLPCPAAASVALRGLLAWVDRHGVDRHGVDQHGVERHGDDPRTDTAIQRGLQSLADLLNAPDAPDLDATDLAIILWQLGDQPAFRALVDVSALVARLDSLQTLEKDGDDILNRYVHAIAA